MRNPNHPSFVLESTVRRVISFTRSLYAILGTLNLFNRPKFQKRVLFLAQAKEHVADPALKRKSLIRLGSERWTSQYDKVTGARRSGSGCGLASLWRASKRSRLS